ncbi:hypothetical protein [Streptomyces sp. NPDC047014]|uniref:hypothetical protein n=1 Tax=Streptomyces sp. NPDC047014 TaxID=3155736 RepID=UPI0033EED3E1
MLAETICYAASAAGLGIAALTAYRKRFLAAARTAAFALVPAGLALTGIVQWLSGLVFDPAVWIGFGLLALSALLLLTTRAIERRRPGGRRKAASDAPPPVVPTASRPSLGTPNPTTTPRRDPAPADDFSDIEAILKKHGI